MTTVRIERLGHLGDGIAPGPVYVPGALPGEIVSGRIVDGLMQDPRIEDPSPSRVRPPCPHARTCGGCQLQHADDRFVAGWKLEVVRAALEGQGIDADPVLLATSPPGTRRRATLTAVRTRKGALAGFHRKRSDIVVAVPECRVLHPGIVAAIPLAEALARLGASRKGGLAIQMTMSDAGLDLRVTGGKPADAVLSAALADLARLHDVARITWDGMTLTRRPPVIRLGRAGVVPPPGAFLQATADGEAALVDAVRAALPGRRRVADLFAGCGTFALPLAETASVHAVEGDRDMLAALDHANRHAQGLKPVTSETRDLFRDPLSNDELSRFDGIVIDPPRAGAAAQIAQLARSAVPRIACVSCSPVTFARDIRQLVAAGYRLGRIGVVDQFRWSTHVEVVAALEWPG